MSFSVTYDGNGATSGTVPNDGNVYATGATVQVLDNIGNLKKGNDTFARWNTKADGTGDPFMARAPETFQMGTSNVTLYAQWYTNAGLPNIGHGVGATEHYTFFYESSLQGLGLEPARTEALMRAAESDYSIMSDWFGGTVALNSVIQVPIPTYVANLSGGANVGSNILLKPGAGNAKDLRYLIVAEVTEIFMKVQNQGWFAPDGSNEQSCGEGLSHFLAQQFLVKTGIGIIEPGSVISPMWLNSSLQTTNPSSTQLYTNSPATTLAVGIDSVTTSVAATTAPSFAFEKVFVVQIDGEQMLVNAVDKATDTLTVIRGYNGTLAAPHASGAQAFLNYGSRGDYINVTLEWDHDTDAATGCATLFLYYLQVQFGFSINAIIAAAPGVNQASSCLRGVYRNLTGDNGDPFPFFKRLLDEAFPPDQVAAIPGANPDNPWPLGSLTFYGAHDTWGHDEVSDIISTSGGLYPNAFWIVLEGFNQQVVGSATPSKPIIAFGPDGAVTSSLSAAGIILETTNPKVPQRIRYPYDVFLTSSVLASFPSSGETFADVTSAITLLGKTIPLLGEFFFTAGANPYFTNVLPNPNPADENAPYLSGDLRVFTATPLLDTNPVPNAPSFSTDSIDGACNYITALIPWLNQNHGDPLQKDPFDSNNGIIPGQQTSLNSDSSVTPWTLKNGQRYNNYNFAIARVRLRGTSDPSGVAEGVRVFFRLWGTQTADTDWDPNYTYLSSLDGDGNPLWPMAPSDDHTVPFFATNNPDLTKPDNAEYGTHGVNNQTITIRQGDVQWAYFGCFLNLYDTNLSVNGTAVIRAFPGSHHCLVAQIAYANAPIQNVKNVIISPENSDQLAQRNLQVTPSDNPGPPATHRVPQTFDTRLSTATENGERTQPDELMIDWGSTPVGSIASIYWPQLLATDILALASRNYASHPLSAADAHTIRCKTVAGTTYIPIPFGSGASLAGLFTVDLPPTVKAGQQFDIVFRRVTTRPFVAPPRKPSIAKQHARRFQQEGVRRAVDRPHVPTTERVVVGSFQVRIPVNTATKLLPSDETLLAILKARFAAMAPSNRWYPVLRRYMGYVCGRVDGLGGNASAIPASFTGAPEPGYGDGEVCHKGVVTGLVFDSCGNFEGFVLAVGASDEQRGELRFDSRVKQVRELVECAWQERQRITVFVDVDEPRRVCSIVLHKLPEKLGE